MPHSVTKTLNLIPSAPGFVRGQSYGAALVCDADHAHHGDCHSSPFRVVFAYSEYMPPGPFHPPSSIRIFVYVYSSVTRSWGGRPAAVMRARARGGTSTGSRAPCPATATPLPPLSRVPLLISIPRVTTFVLMFVEAEDDR